VANPFVHVELNTTDVSKAKSFYGKLFEWTLEDVPAEGMEYTMIKVGTGTGGGIMKHPVPGAPSAWLAYVEVDDVAAATAKAKSLGATVMKDVTEVMGAGWLSIIVDPTGAALGLWKSTTACSPLIPPAPQPPGAGIPLRSAATSPRPGAGIPAARRR
jgi:predicted enzyme related to lactoylglutathione lyase